MIISVDLDGVICELKQADEFYTDVLPKTGAVKTLQDLKAAGHYIIIQTARHMHTCNGDVNKVVARIGKITLDWLHRYEIPYDEIHFGKPNADVYIDDRALKFKSWGELSLDDYHEDSR